MPRVDRRSIAKWRVQEEAHECFPSPNRTCIFQRNGSLFNRGRGHGDIMIENGAGVSEFGVSPRNVEAGDAALLTLRLQARGVESTEERQGHGEDYYKRAENVARSDNRLSPHAGTHEY